MNKIFFILIFLCSNLLALEKDVYNLLKEKTNFTEQEITQVIKYYNEFKKDIVLSDWVENFIREGVHKKVPYTIFISAFNKKNEQISLIKSFCKDTYNTKLRIEYDKYNLNKLLLILDSDVSFEEIKFFHKMLLNYRIKSYDYLDFLKNVSILKKAGVEIDFINKIVETSIKSNKIYNYLRKIMLEVYNKRREGEIIPLEDVLEVIKDNRNFYEIDRNLEFEIKNFDERKTKTQEEIGEKIRTDKVPFGNQDNFRRDRK